MKSSNIVILGAGNVASNFVDAIKNTKIKILQIYNRHIHNAEILCKHVNAEAIDNIDEITLKADAYFFMLSDDGIVEISKKIKQVEGVLVHTAGSLSKNIFKNKSENYGVFYPFQTFSKNVEVDFAKIPVFIDASNEFTANYLNNFAEKLNCKSYFVDEEKRKNIHLSGVFACNFMNHCIYLGEKILEEKGIDKQHIKPLLEQSFLKVLSLGAEKSQTGPAKRMDEVIISKHLEMLESNKLMSDIYNILTESIYKTYNKD